MLDIIAHDFVPIIEKKSGYSVSAAGFLDETWKDVSVMLFSGMMRAMHTERAAGSGEIFVCSAIRMPVSPLRVAVFLPPRKNSGASHSAIGVH